MRIVHIITRMILGGAQENTLHTVEDLAEDFGDDVTLITGPAIGPEGDLLERAHRGRQKVIVVNSLRRAIRPIHDIRAYLALKTLLRSLRPDVVHTHSSKAGILGRAAAGAVGIPAIVHTIHGLPFHPSERWWKNRIYVVAERWAAKRTDRFITVADAMIDQAVAAGLAPRDRFVTIHSGMDVDAFLHPPRDRDAVRSELGYRPEHVVIGKFARLFERKGHDDVIATAAELTARFPNVRFLFVGGGAWRDRLEQMIRKANLCDYFHFTGLQPTARMPELIAATDIVVHASYREGLARVLPQALITGRPVVAYDLDGAREVVLPDQTGFLVEAGNLGDLTERLSRLIENPALRSSFGAAGRTLFADQFRHEAATVKIRSVYDQILAEKSSR